MVIPFTCAFTSSRRFTLLNVFSAAAISSFEIPYAAARAAAAVAFHTLYSPASGNSRSAQACPLCNTDHEVRPASNFRFVIRHSERALAPYLSTGQKALLKQRSRLGLSPVSPAI